MSYVWTGLFAAMWIILIIGLIGVLVWGVVEIYREGYRQGAHDERTKGYYLER